MKFSDFRFVPLLVALAVSSPAAQFKFGPQTLTVPDGFTVEQVAGTNLVLRPVEADFDEQGRLYVTDSSGSNEKAAKQLQEKTHRVMRLEDTDGDGRFDKSTVFADKMTFPEGCMWYDGSLYVSGVPTIWKLTDTNNDGIADVRDAWHDGKTVTGCGNDLHGPYLGPDGWIYWCKGAFAEQTYERPGQAPFVTKAAHIFRKRPEGGLVEPVMTAGMENPVGLTFTQDGERILSCTFFMHPEGGKRDGLVHTIYGGVYGHVNSVLDDVIKTGELMPVLTHLGPAAPCGLTRYQSTQFGNDFRNNLFVSCFNLRKVVRVIMENDGATYKTHEQDFLVSDQTDFHPTDVLEDADGSLIVVDTGGWYKICCPTSQLWKPDVLGAIYRIRRTGAHQVNDPRGLKLDWSNSNADALVKLLDDQRPAVVEHAIQQLAKNGQNAVSSLSQVLASSTSVEARRNALWALTRINLPQARDAARKGLADADESVRHTALHSVSVWRDAAAQSNLQQLVRNGSAQIKRAAAEALGRLGDKAAVPALLAAAPTQHDRVLEHSLTYAMIEIGDPATAAAGITDSNPFTQRCALIALDQMPHSGLKPAQVTPLLLSSDAALKETGSWLVAHHPEWGEALAGFFRDALAKTADLDKAGQSLLEDQLAQLASGATVQKMLATTVAEGQKPAKIIALHAMAQSHLKAAPVFWAKILAETLADPDPDLVREAVFSARNVSFATNRPGLSAALLKVAHNGALPAEERLDALTAVRGQILLDAGLFDFLRANLDQAKPLTLRGNAAAVLERAKASPEQLLDLTQQLKLVGPMELTHLLGAYEHSTNEDLGLSVVAALKEAKAHSSLRAETVKPKLAKFPATVQRKLNQLLASLNVDAAKQKAHIEELVAAYKGGSIYHGQAVFNSPKAGCVICHAIGYVGGHVGPDLTRIGQIRTERDLFEAIVYPSASFVRSYEPLIVSTKDGEEYSGVVKKDAPDEIILATGPLTEQRIPRANIADMRPGAVSIMPQGFDELLTHQELTDLVTFLKSQMKPFN